jgi:hypothetical protein
MRGFQQVGLVFPLLPRFAIASGSTDVAMRVPPPAKTLSEGLAVFLPGKLALHFGLGLWPGSRRLLPDQRNRFGPTGRQLCAN